MCQMRRVYCVWSFSWACAAGWPMNADRTTAQPRSMHARKPKPREGLTVIPMMFAIQTTGGRAPEEPSEILLTFRCAVYHSTGVLLSHCRSSLLLIAGFAIAPSVSRYDCQAGWAKGGG